MGIVIVWEVRHSIVVVVVESESSSWLVGRGRGWEGLSGDVEGGGGKGRGERGGKG